ncbi:hypothetical protein [Clostridium sp.]
MDYKDVLAIILAVIFAIVIIKFFPNNSLSIWGNYIKGLFKHK